MNFFRPSCNTSITLLYIFVFAFLTANVCNNLIISRWLDLHVLASGGKGLVSLVDNFKDFSFSFLFLSRSQVTFLNLSELPCSLLSFTSVFLNANHIYLYGSTTIKLTVKIYSVFRVKEIA